LDSACSWLFCSDLQVLEASVDGWKKLSVRRSRSPSKCTRSTLLALTTYTLHICSPVQTLRGTAPALAGGCAPGGRLPPLPGSAKGDLRWHGRGWEASGVSVKCSKQACDEVGASFNHSAASQALPLSTAHANTPHPLHVVHEQARVCIIPHHIPPHGMC